MEKRLLIVFEPQQVSEIIPYYEEHRESCTIVALDFWAERDLAKAGIPFDSLSTYCPPWENQSALITTAENLAREWYRLPEMAFFQGRGIRIGESLELAFEKYLGQALYYLNILSRTFDEYPDTNIVVVPQSVKPVPAAGAPFTAFENRLAADTVAHLAMARGIEVEMIGTPPVLNTVRPFPPQSILQTFFLRLYNRCMGLIAHRKPLQIFASEYWFHISAFMESMNDAELILMDRSEGKNIPFTEIWKHRVRFMHPLVERTRTIRRTARVRQEFFRSEWKEAAPAVEKMSEFSYRGVSFWPLVKEAFDFIITTYAERIVSDIEGIHQILVREKINRVLLRASTGLHQHHFLVIAHLAYQLGIPSIEIQHGVGVFEASSPDSVLTASYLASYGPIMHDVQIENYGLAPERVPSIGSPRFDHYVKTPLDTAARESALTELGLDPKRPVAIVPVPAEVMSLAIDHHTSYEIADFFKTLAAVKERLPEIQYLFKFRGSNVYAHRWVGEYVRELFPGAAITKREAIFPLLQLADVVITARSTVVCEALLAERPLILFPWRSYDPHLPLYRECGIFVETTDAIAAALQTLISDAEFRARTIENGRTFLAEKFSFDGRAAQRTVELLHQDLKTFPPLSTQSPREI